MTVFVQTFEGFKIQLKEIIEDLFNKNFLTESQYKELINSLDKEKLTISIIGQMKYGKSTFINAFIFKKPFLPTSDIPMTAALTAIQHNPEEEFTEVEFYTHEEWEDLKKGLKEGRFTNDEEKKAVEETIEMAESNLGKDIYNFLGTKKRISFSELEDYVGAEGRYTPIVKLVNIYIKNNDFKDTVIVDTPGFNDPIVSREKRAFEFLKETDVAILFLYAQRPFDNSDRDLIIRRLANTGIGKIVVAINKVDMILEDLGALEKVKKHVEEQYRKSVEEIKYGERIKEVLLNAPIIPLSSLMALLGRMPEDLIEQDENLMWYYEDFRNKFPFLRTKEDFEKWSGMLELEQEIAKIIKSERIEIMKNSFKTRIVGCLQENKEKLSKDVMYLKEKLNNLKKSNEELEEKKKAIEEVKNEDLPKIIGKLYPLSLDKIINCNIAKIREYILHEIAACKKNVCGAPYGGFFDKGKFGAEFNKNISAKFDELNAKISGDINDLKAKLVDKISEIIKQISDELKLNTKLKKYTNYSEDDFKSVSINLQEVLRMDLEQEIKNIKVPKINTGWFVFGDNEEEAKEKATQALEKFGEQLINKLYEIAHELRETVDTFLGPEGQITKKIEEQLINPILKAIDEVQRNREEILKNKKNIEQELIKILNDIKKLEEEINRVNDRISKL